MVLEFNGLHIDIQHWDPKVKKKNFFEIGPPKNKKSPREAITRHSRGLTIAGCKPADCDARVLRITDDVPIGALTHGPSSFPSLIKTRD